MGMSENEIRQLQRRVSELEALVKGLLAPKSKARIIVGDSGGGAKFIAKLTASLASGTAAGTEIYSFDGMTPSYIETATIYDPLFVFAPLGNGDWLYCTKQNGKYYAADNASCAGTSPLIDTPPESGPPGEPV